MEQQKPQNRRRGPRGGREKGKQSESQNAETIEIICPFCRNKMPSSSIFGKYKLKLLAINYKQKICCIEQNELYQIYE